MCLVLSKFKKFSHDIVKLIIKYSKGIYEYGLWNPRETHFDLCAHIDSDYVGSRNAQKNTSGVCYFLEYCLISWHYKKQTLAALLTV